MSSDIASNNIRVRCWAVLVYEESAKPNWRELLDSYNVPWAESPVHDCDVNEDGELKKPHIHVLLYFAGKKSYEQMKQICDFVQLPRPEPVHEVRSYVRYFIHLDDPDKAQYNFDDIRVHKGMRIDAYFTLSEAEKHEKIAEMEDFIREHDITEYFDFIAMIRDLGHDDWHRLVHSGCGAHIDRFIRSNRHRGMAATSPEKK